jgi:hypothetical protein
MLRSTINAHTKLRDEAQTKLDAANKRRKKIEKSLKSNLEQKEALHAKFNRKYSRFI